MCDEIERSVHDALCVVKRVLESKQVVPGGGCCETALSIYLENFATTVVCILLNIFQSEIRILSRVPANN
jgi:chaperonin GroEL (HSP60 family)